MKPVPETRKVLSWAHFLLAVFLIISMLYTSIQEKETEATKTATVSSYDIEPTIDFEESSPEDFIPKSTIKLHLSKGPSLEPVFIKHGKRSFEVRSKLISRNGSKADYNVTVINRGKGVMHYWSNDEAMQPWLFTAIVSTKDKIRRVEYMTKRESGDELSRIPLASGTSMEGFRMFLSGGMTSLAEDKSVTKTMTLHNLPEEEHQVAFVVDIGTGLPPYIGPVDLASRKAWFSKYPKVLEPTHVYIKFKDLK